METHNLFIAIMAIFHVYVSLPQDSPQMLGGQLDTEHRKSVDSAVSWGAVVRSELDCISNCAKAIRRSILINPALRLAPCVHL